MVRARKLHFNFHLKGLLSHDTAIARSAFQFEHSVETKTSERESLERAETHLFLSCYFTFILCNI